MFEEQENPSLSLGVVGERAEFNPMGPRLERPTRRELLVWIGPLVGGGRAYTEPAARLAEGRRASLSPHGESGNVRLGGARRSPRQQGILLGGESCERSGP